MTWDSIFVAGSETTAALVWAFFYRRIKEGRFRFFAIYLWIIAGIELLNLFIANSWTNDLVFYFNIPLEFIFLICFLIMVKGKAGYVLAPVFIFVYLVSFIAERLHYLVPPVNFDSLSYGIGYILLISAIIIALVNIFKEKDLSEKKPTGLFRIVTGMMIFYIGSFPYEIFRNYIWSNPAYYGTAYFLHYLSQGFNCIMYLIFAFSIKWTINLKYT